MFPFQINNRPSSRFIYCIRLDLECRHLHRLLQVTTQPPPRVATGGSLPEQDLFDNADVSVCSVFTTEDSKELIV
jgi:hypothetical protein